MAAVAGVMPWPKGVDVHVQFNDRFVPVKLQAAKDGRFVVRTTAGVLPADAAVVVTGPNKADRDPVVSALRAAGFTNINSAGG